MSRELDFFRVDQLELLVEDVGSLVEPPLLLAEVAAGSIDLGLEVLAPLEDFLLGGQLALPADRLGLERWRWRGSARPARAVFARNRAIRYAPASPISTPKSNPTKPLRETPPGRGAT